MEAWTCGSCGTANKATDTCAKCGAAPPAGGADRTELKRVEQYRDRWSSHGANTGILIVSDRLSAHDLRQFEIFADYEDKFLEKISPDVSVCVWKKGAVLFEQGSYLDLAFFVAKGKVQVFVEQTDGASQPLPIFDAERTVMMPDAQIPQDPVAPPPSTRRPQGDGTQITFLASMDFDLPRGAGAVLGPGEFFGEIGALTGWPQSVTARTVGECSLVQIRMPALRLMRRKSKALKNRLDKIYRERSLFSQLKTTPLFREVPDMFLDALKEAVQLISYEHDEVVFNEGEPVDALYLVRSGFVKLEQQFAEGSVVVSYLSKGMTLGEIELLLDGLDGAQVTARSVEHSELVRIPHEMFDTLLSNYPHVREQLWQTAAARVKEAGFGRRNIAQSEFNQVALDRGLVQGNSILVIDLEVCTRCDDCVRACAATHGGRPRFVREGEKYGNLLIARSCYHCRDPVCLVGCPTGAIHRAGVGAVVAVDDAICIGCNTCANACPYDAIVMHETGEKWPDDMIPSGLRGKPRLVASKCNLCHDTGHGPACVSNCPQGCAVRVGSLDEFQQLLTDRDDE